MTLPVYIIINEWTAIDNSTRTAVVDGEYFETMEEAWSALRLIGEPYGVELLPDETSIQMENSTPSIEYEEYYIQELTRG